MEGQEPLRIENGRFMRGDKVVKPEIGNVEQIALLKKMEREAEKAEDEGIKVEVAAVDIEYTVQVRFTCVCGHRIREDSGEYRAFDMWDLDDPEWDENDEVVCPKCGRVYEIEDGRAKVKRI